MKIPLLIIALFALALGCSESPPLNAEAAFKTFQEARNLHDLEMIMRHVDKLARFEYDRSDYVHGVDEFRQVQAFDAALDVAIEYRIPMVEADTVVAIVTETNNLRRALGAGSEVYRARYIFYKGKLAYRHYTRLTSTGRPLEELLPAFLSWAEMNYPDDYQQVVNNGELVRSRQSAEILEELLSQYPDRADSLQS